MITLGALMGFLLLSSNPTIPRPIGYVPPAPTAMGSMSTARSFGRFGTVPSVGREVPQKPVSGGYTVTLTAYNAVPEQTDESPFETASGLFSNPEIVAARSVNLANDLPFGTVIEFDGSSLSSKETCGFGVVAPLVGYRVIADSMNSRFTDRIDILFPVDANYTNATGSVNAAKVLGICQGVIIRVVGRINMKRPPQTQAELVEIVNGNLVALAK